MYAVLQEHLKTNQGKSLVSQFEGTCDLQSIYQELINRPFKSTSAQFSGDILLS
jgi:hypothetical protein